MTLSPLDRIQAIDFLSQKLANQFQYDNFNLTKIFSYGWEGISNLSDDQLINQLSTHRHSDSMINSFLVRILEDSLVSGNF